MEDVVVCLIGEAYVWQVMYVRHKTGINAVTVLCGIQSSKGGEPTEAGVRKRSSIPVRNGTQFTGILE